jgi:hypothetical protein
MRDRRSSAGSPASISRVAPQGFCAGAAGFGCTLVERDRLLALSPCLRDPPQADDGLGEGGVEAGGLLEGTSRLLEPPLLLERIGEGQVHLWHRGCLGNRGSREALRHLGSSRSPGRLGAMEIENVAAALEGLEHRERLLRATDLHQANRRLQLHHLSETILRVSPSHLAELSRRGDRRSRQVSESRELRASSGVRCNRRLDRPGVHELLLETALQLCDDLGACADQIPGLARILDEVV